MAVFFPALLFAVVQHNKTPSDFQFPHFILGKPFSLERMCPFLCCAAHPKPNTRRNAFTNSRHCSNKRQTVHSQSLSHTEWAMMLPNRSRLRLVYCRYFDTFRSGSFSFVLPFTISVLIGNFKSFSPAFAFFGVFCIASFLFIQVILLRNLQQLPKVLLMRSVRLQRSQ